MNKIMNDHTPKMAFWILRDNINQMNCTKKFRVKYHHNFVWDKHFKDGGAQ